MAKKKKTAPMSPGLLGALQSIEKEFGKGAIQKMDSNRAIDVPAISTGSPYLDAALGIGGVPRGRIVEIYGPESSGKTTVCQHIIANAQAADKDAMCGFIDVEHALDPVYLVNTGVDMGRLLISQPDCGEDALQIAETLIRSNELAVVVIDSVAALVPRAEIEGQMGDSHMGLQARLMSQALRKLAGAVSSSKTCLIFTNQIREKIGVVFGNPETTAGGNALKFYASIRMDIRRKQSIKMGDEIIGNEVKVKIVKNKMAAPFRTAEFDIIYPNGISYERGLLKLAEEKGVINKSGSWYSFGTDNIGQGFEQAYEAIKEDEKLKNMIVEQLDKLKAEAMEPAQEEDDNEETSE